MANETDIAALVAIISAAYPNFNATKETVEVYYQLLKDIPQDLLRTSILKTLSEPGRKFAPSVGEIRGAVSEIHQSIDNVPSEYEAWALFKKAIFNGYPLDVHPLVVRAGNLVGGVSAYGASNVNDEPSWRARYVDAYRGLVDKHAQDELMLPDVRGYIEDRGGELPPAIIEMDKLTEKMSVPKLLHPHTGEILE